MTPETLLELAKVIGAPAAILLYIWFNRSPASKEPPPANNLAQAVEALRDEIAEGRDAMHRLESKVDILLDRGSRK